MEESELTRLLQAAKDYEKLDNFNEEKKTYETITKKYPQSFEGWWGLAQCEMKEEHQSIMSNKYESRTWLSNNSINSARKFADESQLDMMNSKIKEFDNQM